MNIWDEVNKNHPDPFWIGGFVFTKFEYTDGHGNKFSGIWLECPEGEGMGIQRDKIPEIANEAELRKYWDENF